MRSKSCLRSDRVRVSSPLIDASTPLGILFCCLRFWDLSLPAPRAALIVFIRLHYRIQQTKDLL